MGDFYNTAQGNIVAFSHHPGFYLVTVFALILVTLLALEWIWRLVWCFFEEPRPLKHPSTILRVVHVLLLVSIIMRVGPGAVQLMTWKDASVADQHLLAAVNNISDALSILPFSIAWLIVVVSWPMLAYQLDKAPPPFHLWPTPSALKRPLKIGLGVFAIAAALTFLQ